MKPAAWVRDDVRSMRLLVVRPGEAPRPATVQALAAELSAGDLLVVNDAATLPGALRGRVVDGAAVELRLAGDVRDDVHRAVLFGAGDWRTRTELRPPPPPVSVGTRLDFDGLGATVTRVDARSPRLVDVRFDAEGAALWPALYRRGRPIQYAHLRGELALWHVQTPHAARPWAAEPPSAGFALTTELVLALVKKGVRVASLTHAAGLSATGDAALDAMLPLEERCDLPASTVRAVTEAKARGGRVVALGTTVARALEGSGLQPGVHVTSLTLGPETQLQVVDGIVTGVHELGSSHLRLLEAFAPLPVLRDALTVAEAQGFEGHELGDAMLVLRG